MASISTIASLEWHQYQPLYRWNGININHCIDGMASMSTIVSLGWHQYQPLHRWNGIDIDHRIAGMASISNINYCIAGIASTSNINYCVCLWYIPRPWDLSIAFLHPFMLYFCQALFFFTFFFSFFCGGEVYTKYSCSTYCEKQAQETLNAHPPPPFPLYRNVSSMPPYS